MDRLACVDLPEFPLQILLTQHPDWADWPVAVVDRDAPQGQVVWLNARARAGCVRPGMRYSAALSLVQTLRAGVVPPAVIARSMATVVDQLQRFSPEVEPCEDEPGVFWLNASGLSQLYASPRQWAASIRRTLQVTGFQATVTVGATRFGTYVSAKTTRRGIVVMQTASDERAWIDRAPLDRVRMASDVQDRLRQLGVRTVRALLELPARGLRQRFGEEVYRLHRLASGASWAPLQPQPIVRPLVEHCDFDRPETDLPRLLFAIKPLLHAVLREVRARHAAVAELALWLQMDHAGAHTELIRPAAPTVEIGQLLNLIRLRIESLTLRAGVIAIRITARAVRTVAAQVGLFAEQPRRDLAAANRALARVRAEFGNDVVVRARLTEGHLPEAQFVWEPIDVVPRAVPRDAARLMIRRVHARSIALPPRPRRTPDGWLVRGGPGGHAEALAGPYRITGGWWRMAVQREYYFARMRDGELLWIYYDCRRRRWRWQGQVE